MKIGTLGLIALVLFVSTVPARADSSAYIHDENGCWYTEGPTCVWHDSFWDKYDPERPSYLSRYRNDCGLRILLKACHQAPKHPNEYGGFYCWWYVIEPGEVEVMVTSIWEPTGRSEFRWIGSTIADNDGVCANKSGVNDWWPD